MPANPLEWRHEQTGRCERFAELDAIIASRKGVWARSRPAYRARRRAYLEGKRDHHKKRPMTHDTQATLQSGGNYPLARAEANQAA